MPGTYTKVSVVAALSRPQVTLYKESPISANIVVSVVDDDESVRESLPDLLRTFGYAARGFASAEEFLASGLAATTRCLVLDIAMPGMSGPELYAQVVERYRAIPVIFITGNSDSATCDDLLAQGAVACLRKPFDPQALVEAVRRAVS